jgi:hypothetical protein
MLRAAVLAALSALLAAVGHVAGGGAVPDLAILAVLSPLLAGVFVTVAERCRGMAGTLATLGAGQFALHQLMVLMHPAHHVEHGVAVPSATLMLGMHAAGTLVTAVLVRHADRAVTGLVAALRRIVRRRSTPPPADRPLPTLAVPGPAVPSRLALVLSAADVRRGPPVAS